VTTGDGGRGCGPLRADRHAATTDGGPHPIPIPNPTNGAPASGASGPRAEMGRRGERARGGGGGVGCRSGGGGLDWGLDWGFGVFESRRGTSSLDSKEPSERSCLRTCWERGLKPEQTVLLGLGLGLGSANRLVFIFLDIRHPPPPISAAAGDEGTDGGRRTAGDEGDDRRGTGGGRRGPEGCYLPRVKGRRVGGGGDGDEPRGTRRDAAGGGGRRGRAAGGVRGG